MTIQQEKHPGKEPYAAPEMEVLEVKPEGIVCASGGEFPNLGPEQTW